MDGSLASGWQVPTGGIRSGWSRGFVSLLLSIERPLRDRMPRWISRRGLKYLPVELCRSISGR